MAEWRLWIDAKTYSPTDQGRPRCFCKHEISVQSPWCGTMHKESTWPLGGKLITTGSSHIRRGSNSSSLKYNLIPGIVPACRASISTIIGGFTDWYGISIASEPTLEQSSVSVCSLLWNLLVLLHTNTQTHTQHPETGEREQCKCNS